MWFGQKCYPFLTLWHKTILHYFSVFTRVTFSYLFILHIFHSDDGISHNMRVAQWVAEICNCITHGRVEAQFSVSNTQDLLPGSCSPMWDLRREKSKPPMCYALPLKFSVGKKKVAGNSMWDYEPQTLVLGQKWNWQWCHRQPKGKTVKKDEKERCLQMITRRNKSRWGPACICFHFHHP